MKIFAPTAVVLVLSISALVSPCANAGEGTVVSEEREVARIANRYVVAHYSFFNTVKYPPVVQDKGDTWEVYYHLNPISRTEVIELGVKPVVIIKKNTLKVLYSYLTQ